MVWAIFLPTLLSMPKNMTGHQFLYFLPKVDSSRKVAPATHFDVAVT
jgi:hypothetical protein